MELYTDTGYELAELLTKRYSTSFSSSSTLFPPDIRRHIYAIYGLVRIADEIVDTYRGSNAGALLDRLLDGTYQSISSGFSINPIVHAFGVTARQFGIDESLIAPFFASMRQDLTPAAALSQQQYDEYIYGSAEVVGLMCLRVFVAGNDARYNELAPGAQALGSAYQKINFLRDIRADHDELGRTYFPGVNYDTLSDADVAAIVSDIHTDLALATPYVSQLPIGARRAVRLSTLYYGELLTRLQHTSVEVLKTSRVSLPNTLKLWLYLRVRLGL